MTTRTKIIVAGAVVTALIGLIVIDLATSPGDKPSADEPTTRTTAATNPSTPARETITTTQPEETFDYDAFLRDLERDLPQPRDEATTTSTPRPTDEVPPPVQPNEYTVASGDSFWTIAGKVYGEPGLFEVLQKANPTVDPLDLQPGMKIHVPSRPVRGTTTTTATVRARTADPNAEIYVIKRGDALWNIAKPYARARGTSTPAMVKAIQEANPGLDPLKLQPDTEIVIPR